MRCNPQVLYLVRHRRFPARQLTEPSPPNVPEPPNFGRVVPQQQIKWPSANYQVITVWPGCVHHHPSNSQRRSWQSTPNNDHYIIVSYPSERFGQTEGKYEDHLINHELQGHQNTLPMSSAPNPQEAVQEIYRGGEAVIDRTASWWPFAKQSGTEGEEEREPGSERPSLPIPLAL